LEIHQQGEINRKKIPLLIRKPIFDELKNNLGEAYVEEMISMRSDADYDIFDTTYHGESDH
jgi:hypothetical protein